MYDWSWVQILHAFNNLVQDEAIVNIFEYFLSDCIMQVCFHKFEDQVQIFVVIGFKQIMKLNYILMFKLVEEHNFTIGPLGICRVLERIEYFFQGQSLACFLISYFPHVSVCSASNLLDKLVSVKDVGLNLICHSIKRVFEF